MKKAIVKTLLCGTVIISLTGCGVQNTVEDSTAKGQSKTETLSKEISLTESKPAKVIPSIYPPCECTENCFYTEDGMYIVQCDLDGKELQKFEMPRVSEKNKDEEIEDLYVTDEEILYTVYCEDDKSGEYGFYQQLCSVPIQQDENGEQLLVEQTEKLLQADDGMWVMYADKEVIAYSPGVDDTVPYYEYDRVNKKQIPISKGDKDEYYTLPLGKYGSWGGDCYETVLLARYGKNETSEDTDDHGIYAHKVGSQEIQKVATHYIDRYSDGLHAAAVEGKVYYTCIHDSYTDKYENTDKYSYDIWCYDSATGKNSVLISEKEIKKIEPEFTYINKLFADGNSLYAYGIAETKKEACFVICISQDADGKVKVKPEKELNQILNSVGDEYGYAYIKGIIGGRCYYEVEEEDDGHDVEKRYVFNLLSKESKEVKKSDPEYYFWKYEDEMDEE
ncbi:MAG: hypothetical protein K2K70_05010 [Lachnospiraceae bacterium]|nr:hypothetical protein [Lachnospiraceae bacterium]